MLNFVAQVVDRTHSLAKEVLPLEEMKSLVDDLGVMVCIWEDPQNRPGQLPEDVGKITISIAIPSWDKDGNFIADECVAWDQSMRASEYFPNVAKNLKTLLDNCLTGFLTEMLPHEGIQATRCDQCQTWYHKKTEHMCPSE